MTKPNLNDLAIQGAIVRVMRRFDLKNHPLVYAMVSNKTIYDPADSVGGERYRRCPNCEQWSPCDVRLILTGLSDNAE